MAIMDQILSTPVGIDALRKKNAPRERILDGAFTNLLYYAKRHWSYTASGNTGGEMLLSGAAKQAPCGGIATALKIVFIEGLGVPANDVEYIRVTGYLWTGPTYMCFDPKVVGNLRKLNDRDYRNGCIFNEHYYLKCHGKFYDPCLSTSYMVKDQSIKDKFPGSRMAMVGTSRKILLTSDKQTCILYMPQESVPGFHGAWCMFPATKKNVETALGKQEFKTEMAALRGTTGFAKLVNSLP